jgi:hypothetical protein
LNIEDFPASDLLPLSQALHQGFRGGWVKAVGAVDDDVVLAGNALEEVGVIQVSDQYGIDSLGDQRVGLFLLADKGRKGKLYDLGVR